MGEKKNLVLSPAVIETYDLLSYEHYLLKLFILYYFINAAASVIRLSINIFIFLN